MEFLQSSAVEHSKQELIHVVNLGIRVLFFDWVWKTMLYRLLNFVVADEVFLDFSQFYVCPGSMILFNFSWSSTPLQQL